MKVQVLVHYLHTFARGFLWAWIQCYARFTTHFRSINVLFLHLYLHVYQRTDVVLAILNRIQEEEIFFIVQCIIGMVHEVTVC